MDLLLQLPCALHRLRRALPLNSTRAMSQRGLGTQIEVHKCVDTSRISFSFPHHATRKSFYTGLDYVRRREMDRVSIPSGLELYSLVLPSKKLGLVCAADRWSRLPSYFGGTNSCHSSITGFPLVVVVARSFGNEVPGGNGFLLRHSGDLESSSRTQARPKRQARSLNALANRGGQRSTQQEESFSLTGFGINPRLPSRGRSETIGYQRQPSSWRVNNLSTQSGGRVVVMGSNSEKSSKKLFGVSNYRMNSSLSRRSSESMTTAGQKHLEPVVSKSTSVSSLTQLRLKAKGSIDSPGRPNRNQQEKKPQEQMEKKPRKKVYSVEAQLRRDLNNCSKDGDVLRALEIYDQSRKNGTVEWGQYNFNILLYLCSSAALGTLTAQKSGTDRRVADRLNLQPKSEQNLISQGPPESTNGVTPEKQDMKAIHDDEDGGTTNPVVLTPEVMELAAKRGFEIYEDMKRMQVPPNEATLTAVARLAVKKEDGDLAFQMVKEMAAENIAPKLRSYSPALIIFCQLKAVHKAFEVDAHMVAAGVPPEEPELRALLQLCVEVGLQKEVYSLLHRLRAQARELSPQTVTVIEDWFSGKAGVLAGNENEQPDGAAIERAVVAGGGGWHGLGWLGEGEWKLSWTTIDTQGVCCSCGEQLVTIDLDPQETEAFSESLSKLAASRETKPNEFKKFQAWLARYGPFDAIVDGANVGLYNQNYLQNGFNFFQLNSVVRSAQEDGLTKKLPLILLHHSRTKLGTANSNLGQQLLQRWNSSNSLYTTPTGSNDDWYWLYAAVKNKCLLITNDEMRDHLFELLGTDFFPKWKERHQVRFSVSARGPLFHLPPPYSLVIQESEKGSWHIPKSGGNDIDSPREWLCISRPSISATSDSATPGNNLSQVQEVNGASAKDQIAPASHNTMGTNGDVQASRHPRRSQAAAGPLLSPTATLSDDVKGQVQESSGLPFTVPKDHITSARPNSLEVDGTGKAHGRPKRSKISASQDSASDTSPEVGINSFKDKKTSIRHDSLEVSGVHNPSGQPRKSQVSPDSSRKVKKVTGLTQKSRDVSTTILDNRGGSRS